jgi:hypothetical protein
MEEKLERLLQEKRDLHSTNRLLSHTLQVNNTHFGELQSQQVPPPPLLSGGKKTANYHVTQCGRAQDCQAQVESRLRRPFLHLHPTHLQSWALWVPQGESRGRSMSADLWTLRGFYVGRRWTQARGCVSSSERPRVRTHQGRRFRPTYLTGRAIKGTWGDLGRQLEKKRYP